MPSYLANENLPLEAVQALRAAGHDVLSMSEAGPGTKDERVLDESQLQGRVLLTFDKDFGELVFAKGKDAAAGVILFRTRLRSPETVTQLIGTLRQPIAWEGHYAVVRDGKIRLIELT